MYLYFILLYPVAAVLPNVSGFANKHNLSCKPLLQRSCIPRLSLSAILQLLLIAPLNSFPPIQTPDDPLKSAHLPQQKISSVFLSWISLCVRWKYLRLSVSPIWPVRTLKPETFSPMITSRNYILLAQSHELSAYTDLTQIAAVCSNQTAHMHSQIDLCWYISFLMNYSKMQPHLKARVCSCAETVNMIHRRSTIYTRSSRKCQWAYFNCFSSIKYNKVYL